MNFKVAKTSKKIRDYYKERYKNDEKFREKTKQKSKKWRQELKKNPKEYEKYLKKQREWTKKYQQKKLHKKRLLYARYYQWVQRNRLKILKHYNCSCQLCKESKDKKEFEIHHLIYGNNISCVKPLCKKCHEKVHKYNLKWVGNSFI